MEDEDRKLSSLDSDWEDERESKGKTANKAKRPSPSQELTSPPGATLLPPSATHLPRVRPSATTRATPMPAPAEPPVGNPLPTPQEVRTWSCSRLLDYLNPVFTSFSNDSIRTAFRNAFINGTSFLELCGDPEIYVPLGIPPFPGWCLAKQANDILGKTTPQLQLKRTYLLNRRPRLQLLKCLCLIPCIGRLESAELAVNVQSRKRPAQMADPEDTSREGNYGSALTSEVFPADCSSLPDLTATDFERGHVLAGIVARSVQVEQPAFPGLILHVTAGPLPP
jgi:hypothetical protein